MTAFLEYSHEAHAYYVNGRELPSVTTILDRAGLISQFCKNDVAAARGTEVHRLCALDDAVPGGHDLDLRKVPTGLRGYILAWRRYRTDAGFIPAMIEQRVDSIEHGYSGRLDRVGVRRGQTLLTLLDIKTAKSGAIADYVRLQTAAYALALDPEKVFERACISLRPDGRYNSLHYPAWKHHADRAEWLGIVRKVKSEEDN